MSESLPQLIVRRMAELNAASMQALYRRLPDGDDRISYETLRNLANGTQRATRSPRIPRDLALMLEVTEAEVLDALGIGAESGPWELPPRASGLDQHERQVVIDLIDALLRAKRPRNPSQT